jgi:hypothetical protein
MAVLRKYLRRHRLIFVIFPPKGKTRLWVRLLVSMILVSSQWIAAGPANRRVEGQTSGPNTDGSGTRIFLPIVMKTTGAQLAVVPQPGPYRIGQVLRVDIVVQTSPQIRSAGIALSFNPAVIRCDEVREGTFFSSWAAANSASSNLQSIGQIDNSNGVVTETVVTLIGGPSDTVYAQGPNGTGVVISYFFSVISNGISYINLTDTFLMNNQIQNPQHVEVSIQNTRLEVNILASSTGQTQIDALVGPRLNFAVENSIDLANLETGANRFDGSLTVRSNSDYQVDVSAVTTWIEPNPSSKETAIQLLPPISVQAEGFRKISQPDGLLLSGSAARQSPDDSGQSFPLAYFQVVTTELSTASTSGSFRIILTYNSYVKV